MIPVATRPRAHLLILALILALAGVLRFFSLSALGFWTDELCTLSCSHGWGLQFDQMPKNQILGSIPTMTHLADARPFTGIIPAMARDEAHPPLYFLLLRLWEDLLGDSESAVRCLDVLFSLAAICLLYFTARDSIGSTAALVACLLMSVATPQIQFSQEARNYMPVVTFSLLAVLAIVRLKRRASPASATLLVLALLAMMLTHYFAAGVAGGLMIYALTDLRGRSRQYALVAFGIAAAVYLAIWGRFLLNQIPHFQTNYVWIRDDGPGHVMRLLFNLCKLPVRLVGQWPAWPFALPAICIGAVLLLCVPILFIIRPELRLWIFWLIGSLGVIVAVDLIRSTAQLGLLRYSLFATPALYVLIAGAVSRGRWRFLLPGIAIILAMLSLREAYVPPWKIDFQTPVQLLARHLDSADGLIVSGPDPIADGVMFAACQHYMPQMPATSAVLTGPPNAAVLERLRRCKRVAVIWLWKDRSIPGFDVEEQGPVPYLGNFIVGKFRPPASGR